MKQVIDPKSLEIVEIKSFEQVEGLAARICQEKYDWIIVAGGDGTLRAIIDVLPNMNICRMSVFFLPGQLIW